MTSLVKLNFRVNPYVHDRFLSWVESEHGETAGMKTYETRKAVEEYIGRDGYADLYDDIDEMLETVGRRPEDDTEKKLASVSLEWECRGKLVQALVPEPWRNELVRLANEKDVNPGLELTRAFYARIDGGRAVRMKERWDRVRDDVKALVEEWNGKGDGLRKTQQREIAIRTDVREKCPTRQVPESVMESVIKQDHGWTSDSTYEKYKQAVIDELDLAKHPENPDLYWPAEDVAELTDTDEHTPDFEIYEYEELPADEQIRAMRVTIARKAINQRNNKAKMTPEQLAEEAFGGVPDARTIKRKFRKTSKIDGIEIGTNASGDGCLVVDDVQEITDESVVQAVDGLEPSAPDPSASSDTGTAATATATATDGGTDPDDIESEFNRLDAAEPTG